jgi:hypothetical protein
MNINIDSFYDELTKIASSPPKGKVIKKTLSSGPGRLPVVSDIQPKSDFSRMYSKLMRGNPSVMPTVSFPKQGKGVMLGARFRF